MTGRVPFATDGRRSDATAIALPATPGMHRFADPDLVELVDAVVAAIDTSRTWEVERLATAFATFGAATIFTAELSLNGTPSAGADCICGEGWL